MDTKILTLADNPKKALETFLQELRSNYYDWYAASVKRHYRIWLPIQVVSLLSGFATAILAAITDKQTFETYGWLHWILILLPAIGAGASTIAVQARLQNRHQLRENGRLGIQALLNEGRAKYAAATTDKEYTDLYLDLGTRVNAIEQQQGEGFFSFGRTSLRPL